MIFKQFRTQDMVWRFINAQKIVWRFIDAQKIVWRFIDAQKIKLPDMMGIPNGSKKTCDLAYIRSVK